MPFAVFRRHQRKMLGILAILAMVGFVLSDSLPSLLRSSPESRRADLVVTKLYGKTVRLADLDKVKAQRSLANAFMGNLMYRLVGFSRPQFFGDTSVRALVDALILQHKADELGVPGDAELARQWLRQITGEQMNAALFEELLAPFRSQNQVTGEDMLTALASQIRLVQVQNLPGQPEITPLDVFQAYRDRYERVSARFVRVPVEDFLGQARNPSEPELRAFYDRYKNVPPDPSRPTPGFKVPRLVQVEFVSVDGEAIAREIRARLTEAEVRDYYEQHQHDFELPALPALPRSLFADDDPKKSLTPPPAKPANASPELRPDTAPRYKPLAEVRDLVEADLSREKAQDEIEKKFSAVREAMLAYADAYHDIVDENQEAKERGETARKPLPPRPDLQPIAARSGLQLEATPLLTEQDAEHYGAIARSRVGQSPHSEGRRFAAEMFAASATVFEPIELSSSEGLQFLAWKIADHPPRVPPLAEIRDQAVRAWKLEQARPLARKAAEALADRARKQGGKLTPEVAGRWTVSTTLPVTKLESAGLPVPGQFTPQRARPTEIPEIPRPGETLRDALFALEPGQVGVAPDQPQSAYYVLALDHRIPVNYATLYSPSGPRMVLQVEVLEEARQRRMETWLSQLRAEAGLPDDWSPPEAVESSPGRSA